MKNLCTELSRGKELYVESQRYLGCSGPVQRSSFKDQQKYAEHESASPENHSLTEAQGTHQPHCQQQPNHLNTCVIAKHTNRRGPYLFVLLLSFSESLRARWRCVIMAKS